METITMETVSMDTMVHNTTKKLINNDKNKNIARRGKDYTHCRFWVSTGVVNHLNIILFEKMHNLQTLYTFFYDCTGRKNWHRENVYNF